MSTSAHDPAARPSEEDDPLPLVPADGVAAVDCAAAPGPRWGLTGHGRDGEDHQVNLTVTRDLFTRLIRARDTLAGVEGVHLETLIPSGTLDVATRYEEADDEDLFVNFEVAQVHREEVLFRYRIKGRDAAQWLTDGISFVDLAKAFPESPAGSARPSVERQGQNDEAGIPHQ